MPAGRPPTAPTPVAAVIGPHPSPPNPFGQCFSREDGLTDSQVPHGGLAEVAGSRPVLVDHLRQALLRHHTSEESRARLRLALGRLGFGQEVTLLSQIPENPTTRKGNLAEVILAEYVISASGAELPVYRLRYNPNVEQSMKGDDVLVFDFHANPVRIIVGEAKFRSRPSAGDAQEIVSALERSAKAGLPASLNFVIDRVYELGDQELADRILGCIRLFAEDRLTLCYVGLLLADDGSARAVKRGTTPALRGLVMLSVGVDDPSDLVASCYDGVESDDASLS